MATSGSAGFDLKCIDSFTLSGGCRELVQTGIAIEIPAGYVGLVCPRSGLALKHGVTVLNAPGVIDSDYRGELGVILHNTSSVPVTFNGGDRIAQLVIVNLLSPLVLSQGKMSLTERAGGGFGSTGA